MKEDWTNMPRAHLTLMQSEKPMKIQVPRFDDPLNPLDPYNPYGPSEPIRPNPTPL